MRYDLRILWIEDMPLFYQQTKEILEMYAEDIGVSLKFDYIKDAKEFLNKIEIDSNGFKLYDIFFVDYSLSEDIVGSELIKKLRNKKMDSDILFYSSENEADIRKVVTENLGIYEGVYIANKINFEEKSNYLIRKNARRLTKLSNIRGFLMDQTSENDFIIKSYILHNFCRLTEIQKQDIADILLNFILEKSVSFNNRAEEQIVKLEKNGISNINQTMKIMDELFPIKLKYKIFEKMVKYLDETEFKRVSVQQYIDEIIKTRNTLAHKKLDICRTQKYIKYYDTIKQLENRKCPDSCENHIDDNKYSLDEWTELRKKIQIFGQSMDAVQENLNKDLKMS